MKNCSKYREMTENYIDGLLTDSEKAEFEEHINSCSECMNELNFSRAIRSELKKLEFPQPPSDFIDRINVAINSENKEITKDKKILFFGRRSVSAIAACALIAVFLGVNADNELTKKISINNETSEQVFNDIIKQDTNVASELLAPTEAPETGDKPEKKEELKRTESKIKAETKKTAADENKTEEAAQKESNSAEAATASSAESAGAEAAPELKKEEGAAAENEKEEAVMQFSCTPSVYEDAENNFAEGGSGGARVSASGGGSSTNAANAMPKEKQAIASNFGGVCTITVDDAEAAKKIADEICTETDGTYFMTASEYARFIEALHNAEIGYSSDAPDNADVVIMLEENR